jgi:predicted amidohydrolase
MRINIVQTEYDPTDMERLKEVLDGLDGGITCFPECFALAEAASKFCMQYLNTVSDLTKRIIELVKKTGVILPLIEKHPVMRNRFYNTTYVIHNGDLIGTYRRVVTSNGKAVYSSRQGIPGI